MQNRALEESAAEQGRQARSFERFVPGAFLDLLEKQSVRDVEAGDAKMREMIVRFCDIRGFTRMSEGLGPEASFQFLNDYLQRNQFGTIQEDLVLQDQITRNYQTYYPWQNILYDNQKLELEKKVSYQDLLNSYRRTIPTASDNLQQASQELASGKKRLSGGLNAATIAAGLSDFVVERAQEELNINFLDRMRDNILRESSEFKVLFPHTHNMFNDFQIVHYRT